MKYRIRARTAACVAALSIAGLVAGCSEQELQTNAVDAATEASCRARTDQWDPPRRPEPN